MKKMQRILSRMLRIVLTLLMGGLIVVVFAQVFFRSVLNFPLGGTEELARYLLIYITFLGGAYAIGDKSHMAIDFLLVKLPAGAQKVLLLLVQAILLAASAGILYYGARFAWLSRGTLTPALQQSIGWVYAALPIMGLLAILYLVPQIVEQVRNWNEEPETKIGERGTRGL